jgi:asparaginyl-tRNA synthetase
MRSSGKIHFLQIRDGAGFIQVVADESSLEENTKKVLAELTLESSVIVTGRVKEEPRAPLGYELQLERLTLVQKVTEEYPIGKKEHGADFLLSNRHLWLRSQKQWAIQRVRYHAFMALTTVLDKKGYIRFDSPILTPNACEGTTDLFEIDYFGRPAYLSQSGQLYLEAAIASLGRVYDFGPVFRAEKSKTRRHLNEFWMLDVESAFMELEEMIDFEEQLILEVLNYVLEHAQKELSLLERDIQKLAQIKAPFERISYEEAVERLISLGSDIKWGEDFGNDDEDILFKEHDQPVFVHRYPSEIKSFYFKKDHNRPEFSLSVDLFVPEGYGELIGGGQREDDYDTLLTRINQEGLSQEDFQWYLELRQFGTVPHGGFGIGFERLVAWLTGIEHVRESIPFPRTLNRVYP